MGLVACVAANHVNESAGEATKGINAPTCKEQIYIYIHIQARGVLILIR